MLIIVTLKSLSDNSSISVSFESDDYLDSFFFILPYYYYYFRYVLQFSVEWKTSYLENMEGNSIMHGNGHATAVSGHWWGLQVDPVRSWTGFGFLFAMVIFSAPQASGSSSRRLLVLWALSEAWSVRRFFSMVFLHAQLSAILCACGLEEVLPTLLTSHILS